MLECEVPMWMILNLFMGGLGWADAIMTPDELCPSGSSWRVQHAFSYCGLNDPEYLDCSFGQVKTEVHVCAEETTHSCNSGRVRNEEPCSFEAMEAFDTCQDDSDCKRGSCIPSVDCVRRSPRDLEDEDPDQEELDADEDEDEDEDDGEKSSKADCGCLSTGARASSIAFVMGVFGLGLLRRLD